MKDWRNLGEGEKKKTFLPGNREQDSYVPKGSLGVELGWDGSTGFNRKRKNILRVIYKRLRSMKNYRRILQILLWPLSQFNVSLHACHTNLLHFFLFLREEQEHYQRVYSPDSYATEKLLSAKHHCLQDALKHTFPFFSPFLIYQEVSPQGK